MASLAASLSFAFVIIGHLTELISGESVDLTESSHNSGNSMNPVALKFSMTMNSETLNFNLTINRNCDSSGLVILRNNGINSPWNEQRSGDYAAYQDKNLLAAMLVRTGITDSGDILREYEGTFKHENSYYYLKKDPSKRKKRSGADQYIATKVPSPSLNYALQRLPNVTMPYAGELMSFSTGEKANYIVELLMVVDYSIYKIWYDLSKKKTPQEKRDDAINGIRYFYAQVINGVDLRYYSIGEPDYSIRVRLVAYYIAMTQQDSIWTEANDIRQVINGKVYSDAYKALDALQKWINTSAGDMPTFDQASLITNNILMAGLYNDNTPRSISGLANIQGICSPLRVSVNKEAGEYSDCETIAHELGHNLGAQHDGTSNSCDGSKQYIMSSSPGSLTDATFLNPFKFSSCSIDYFRQYLGTLRMMNANCLLSTNTNYDPNAIDKSSKVPPGQFINIDQQCQHLYGAESFYCGGNLNDKLMCASIWCYDPSIRRCISRVELRAANGTTCGNKKWCVMGQCTASASAPVASDFCLSGDYRGDVIDCKDVISKNPGNCYQSYYNDTCCASCQAIRDRNTASCPYGDTDQNYCRNSIQRQHCYDPNVRQQCCATCKAYEINIPDCLYGDKVSWCSTSDNSVCYSSLSSCCATCYYRYTGYQDCPYGDQVSWCQGLPKTQCFDSSTKATCCIACNSARTSVTVRPRPTTVAPRSGGDGGIQAPDDPNCRDTASYCSTMPMSYCYSTQKLCCKTCKYYNSGVAGCEYGSRFSWCKTIPRSSCNYLENKSDCCDECGSPVAGSSSRRIYFVGVFQFAFILLMIVESQFSMFI